MDTDCNSGHAIADDLEFCKWRCDTMDSIDDDWSDRVGCLNDHGGADVFSGGAIINVVACSAHPHRVGVFGPLARLHRSIL